ncbi:MAG: HAMP domain-containing protein [Magnetovibrio sp.]|nr:HAMP domain-containing protein [Magnetovibrio sp.]
MFVLFVTLFEVAVAVYFKNVLKEDFLIVAKFDDQERNLLRGIAISSEMAYELSIPTRGMVFLRVSLWQTRLKDLSVLEKAYLPKPDGSDASFAHSFDRLQNLLDAGTNDEQLGRFVKTVKRKVNTFNTDLRVAVGNIRTERAKQVVNYGEKSDLFAWILLIIVIIGIGIVMIVVGLFLVQLLRSVKQLERRAKDISLGNYGGSIQTNRTDEIGMLLHSINTMAVSLEDREREIGEFRRRLFQQEKVFTIGSFAAGLAHEIGNPIQALLALNSKAIETLLEDPKDDEIDEAIEALSMANEQIERLSGVVREIREFTHSGEYERELTSLNEVIENTIKLMRFDRRFKHLAIKTDLSAEIPPVLAVGDHLVQVLINLLVNAADAVQPDEGEIVVTTHHINSEIMLAISDNGSGMNAEQLDHVFEPFFTTKAKGKGTGLGLSVCKQIVDEHNGQITISSSVGKGTTVSIRLQTVLEPRQAGDNIK